MKAWKIVLIAIGIIPVLILFPYYNCSNVYQYFYGLFIGLAFYGLYLITLIVFIFLKKKNKEVRFKPLIYIGLGFLVIHFICFLNLNGVFDKQTHYFYGSGIDKHTYFSYDISLFENGKYRLNREYQFGFCKHYGTYIRNNDSVIFNNEFIEFSFGRMCQNYIIVGDSLLPCEVGDSIKYLRFELINY